MSCFLSHAIQNRNKINGFKHIPCGMAVPANQSPCVMVPSLGVAVSTAGRFLNFEGFHMAIGKEIIEASAAKSVIDRSIVHGCCGIAGLNAIWRDAGNRIGGKWERDPDPGANEGQSLPAMVSGVGQTIKQFNQGKMPRSGQPKWKAGASRMLPWFSNSPHGFYGFVFCRLQITPHHCSKKKLRRMLPATTVSDY